MTMSTIIFNSVVFKACQISAMKNYLIKVLKCWRKDTFKVLKPKTYINSGGTNKFVI